jgi:hypothetical protein
MVGFGRTEYGREETESDPEEADHNWGFGDVECGRATDESRGYPDDCNQMEQSTGNRLNNEIGSAAREVHQRIQTSSIGERQVQGGTSDGPGDGQ